MKYKAFSLRALSFIVTLGCVPLLLADSAQDYCGSISFNRRFDVTTTCGGNQSGQVQVNASSPPPVSERKATGTFTLSNIQMPLKTADVGGSCADEDEPFTATKVIFTFALAPESGGAGGKGGAGGSGGAAGNGGSGGEAPSRDATCEVDLKTGLGKDITCTAPSGETCTTRVVAAP